MIGRTNLKTIKEYHQLALVVEGLTLDEIGTFSREILVILCRPAGCDLQSDSPKFYIFRDGLVDSTSS